MSLHLISDQVKRGFFVVVLDSIHPDYVGGIWSRLGSPAVLHPIYLENDFRLRAADHVHLVVFLHLAQSPGKCSINPAVL